MPIFSCGRLGKGIRGVGRVGIYLDQSNIGRACRLTLLQLNENFVVLP